MAPRDYGNIIHTYDVLKIVTEYFLSIKLNQEQCSSEQLSRPGAVTSVQTIKTVTNLLQLQLFLPKTWQRDLKCN